MSEIHKDNHYYSTILLNLYNFLAIQRTIKHLHHSFNFQHNLIHKREKLNKKNIKEELNRSPMEQVPCDGKKI